MKFNLKKIIFLILAVCIVFPVVFAGTIASIRLDHYCLENCSPCLQIEATKCFLNSLRVLSIFLFFALCLVFLLQVYKKYTGFVFYPLSPILLKVRFNS